MSLSKIGRSKSAWFSKWIVIPWLRWRMGRIFFSIDIEGLAHLNRALESGPVIVFPNHSCWWDGFVALMLEQLLGFDFYVMMEKRNLDATPFLRRLGAFEVDLETRQRAALSLRVAQRVLSRPFQTKRTPALFIYPQGKIASSHIRPLSFEPGLEWLLEHVDGVKAIPMACRYEFFKEDRTHIFLRFGPSISCATTSDLENSLQIELDALDEQLTRSSLDGFQRIWQSKLSMNKRWERWKQHLFPGKQKSFESLNQ